MTVEEAIQKHGAMAVVEASTFGKCGDLTPLRKLGLDDDSTADTVEIGTSAYRQLSW
jgi:hypothetical protein